MATSLLALVVPCSILFYGWQATTVVTSPVPLYYCQDHVGMGMTCEDIPYFCNNTYAEMVCPLTCGFCDPQFPITAPPHFTTDDDCIDRIVNGLTCDQLDNFCGDRYAVLLCASTCNFCRPKERNCTLPDSSICEHYLCENSHLSAVTCPHLCGLCNVPSATKTTTLSHVTAQFSTSFSSSFDGICEDKLADNWCALIPNFCKEPYANLLCPKSCGICCEDRVRPGVTCQQMEEQSKNGTHL